MCAGALGGCVGDGAADSEGEFGAGGEGEEGEEGDGAAVGGV